MAQKRTRTRTRKTQDDTASRFELDGEVLEIDVEDLTFGEIEEAEVYFDCAFERIDWESGRALLMITYLAMKRKKPDITMDDLRGYRINQLQKAPKKRPTKEGSEPSGAQP